MTSGRPGTPAWRKAFDRVERVLGEPLEGAVASQQFVDVMAVGIKVRRAATGAARGVVSGLASAVLHTVNMPTREDVQRLHRSLAVLAGEVRTLQAAAPARAPVVPPRHTTSAALPATDSEGSGRG